MSKSKRTKRTDGRYEETIMLGYDENGKAIRKHIYGRTNKEVDEKINAIRISLGKGLDVSAQEDIFSLWSEHWLKMKKTQVGNSQYGHYVTLTLSGYGSMYFYSTSDYVPWYEYYDSINKIVIENGIDYIGDYSFWSCKDSTIIVIPDSVKVFDNFAVPTDAIIYCTTNSAAHSYAIENDIAFVLIDVISATEGSNIGVNSSQQVIYGFTNGISSLADGISVPNGYSLSYDNSVDRVFTGMKITLCDEDGALADYSAVIFGDTNGDGWYDGTDSIIVNCLANGMLTKEQVGEAVYMAADCNHDGVIDNLDVEILEQAGVLLASIGQSKSAEELATDSAYQEYINLIDQTVEENPTGEADTTTENPVDEQFNQTLLQRIFAFIKYFFKLITSIF